MLRRNGKPRSCEPCRISKIRCDHETPKCQKCQARGLDDQCFYHPAPMTKPPGTARKTPESRKRVVKPRLQSETRTTRDHEILTSLHASPTSIRVDEVRTVTSSHGVHGWPTPPESTSRTLSNAPEPSRRSFYLGSTSYASVFAEERPLPDSLHEMPSLSATPTFVPSKTKGSRFCQLGVGHTIISKLKPFSFFEKSIEMYFSFNKASPLVGPLVMNALPQVREDLERLSTLGNEAVAAAYADITRNTTSPLKVPASMMASEFPTLWTGQNLRWETLGVLMSISASNAQFTHPDDPLFTLEDGTKIDKDEFIEDMIHTSNDCISICQVHGAVNDIMVWLVFHNMLVTSNFYGDNYHGVWRRLGDSIAALYAKGIHCEEFDEPFFLRESRRRLYINLFRSDKTFATFFGRPPMMARRYSNRPPPLDLDDNVLATSDPDLLNEALAKLDSEGWNTEGKVWASSWMRLRFQQALFKDRILEQSLAGVLDDDMVQKLQTISSENRRFWETLPSQLRYELFDEENVWCDLESGIVLRMITAYLEHLQMDFQIQRMLRRHTEMATPALLEISMKILSTVLVFNKQRKLHYNIQRHFPTIVLFYCLPSAGVLALELRRCTLANVPLPNAVSRADVIRNLSVLISCLEWVILPGDGNHKLCSELNKMLAMVLDEVLNYQPPANESQDGATGVTLGGLGPGFFDMPLIDGMEPIPTESEDFLNWLDNANWSNTYLF